MEEDTTMRRSASCVAVFWLLPAVLLLVPLASQAADPKLIEGAKKEGEVVWYTTTALEVSKKFGDEFQRKYPFIRVNIFRTNNSPLVARVLSEARAGRHLWDLVGGGGELYTPIMERKLFAQYRSPETKALESDLYDKNSYWTAYTASTYVLGFNTTQVKKESVPKTYEALLDPKWKGRKIAVDTSGGMLHALSEVWGKEKTIAYFKQLAAQEAVAQEGNTLRAQLIAAGEYPVGFVLAHGTQLLTARGAPTDWIALEPAVMRIIILALAAKTPHPNAARLFYDYAISKEGQEILKSFNRVPIRNDVDPDPPRLIRGYKRVTMFPETYSDLEATQRIYNEIFRIR
jgi:iron(III) transport system substrate-binding protein